jgi:hypothetical protein
LASDSNRRNPLIQAPDGYNDGDYEVLKGGMLRLKGGRTTQLGGMTEEQLARTLLLEIIWSGVADQEGLGRPKQK